MEETKTIHLFPKQSKATDFTTQFGLLIAGVQSGKTTSGACWVNQKMKEFPDKIGAIIAPTYKILQQSTLPKFFQLNPSLRSHYKEQKGVIDRPTGGKIFIRSADNPFGLEGMTLHWWWLDEGGMASVLAWTVLRSRVSMTGGQGFITTTPYNMEWLYKDFYLKWANGEDKDLSVFKWKSTENPYFPKKFYEAERTRLRAEEFARRYEGEFTKMTGLVYDIPDKQIIDPLNIMKRAEARLIGIDWGFKNPAAIVVLYLWDNTWYVVDEWRQSNRTTAEIIQVINNKITEHRATRVYPDPAEPDRSEECRRAGIPVMDVVKDVKGGISRIQQLIKEKRFYVFNRCQEFISEASMYHYEEPQEDKENKDEPVKFNDHLMDATRYVINSYKPSSKIPAMASEATKPYYNDLGF